ncbi:MAG TPA: RiPP maturation radical SAM C-methyltransferase [Methylobacter sp.]|jgi:magnesium-protoporphyrin IX monomethyl ester (oxidative) cyclase
MHLLPERKIVALVTMPWAQPTEPSLPMGTMHANLEENGYAVHSFSYHIEFYNYLANQDARLAELSDYQLLPTNYGIGDWVFDVPPFCNENKKRDESFANFFEKEGVSSEKALIYAIKARKYASNFLNKCRHEILSLRPDYIIFFPHDMEFVASLALSKLISDTNDKALIGFSGASCDEPIGSALINNFSFINFVGGTYFDIEASFLLKKKETNESHYKIQTNVEVDFRKGGKKLSVNSHLGGAAPVPNYKEYFERLDKLDIQSQVSRMLWIPIETSRGCWWAEKVTCEFCALTADSPNFRVLRKPEEAIQQLAELADRHSYLNFHIMDWIQPKDNEDELFRTILDSGLDLHLYVQIRPSVKRSTLLALSKLDSDVQLGIESLSTSVLKKMKKGTTVMQCIRCLRWCAELNLRANWNLIYNFPGITEDEYRKMAELIPSLVHLHPPDLHHFRLKKQSPIYRNMMDNELASIRPGSWYRFIYPMLDDDAITQIADEFEFQDASNKFPPDACHTLINAVEEWKKSLDFNYRRLSYRDGSTFLILHDFRTTYGSNRYVLRGVERNIYLACEEGLSIHDISSKLFICSINIKYDEIKEYLESMVHEGLMYEENGRYLSLAVPEAPRNRQKE